MKKSTITITGIAIIIIGLVAYSAWPDKTEITSQSTEDEIVLETPETEKTTNNEIKATTPVG
jgi:hypothetical protein